MQGPMHPGWRLPWMWKWVRLHVGQGRQWLAVCKACRREAWRDCTKLEDDLMFDPQEFYREVGSKIREVPRQTRQDDGDVSMSAQG